MTNTDLSIPSVITKQTVMKNFILLSLIAMLILIYSFGISKKEANGLNAIYPGEKTLNLRIDTFRAIRRIFPSAKGVAEDTIILIIHDNYSPPGSRPPVTAGSRISFEIYGTLNPLTGPRGAKAAADTMVLTGKPHKAF